MSELRRLEQRYRTLIDHVDVGICIARMKFDADGRAVDYQIVDGNRAYERHTGLYGSIGKWVSEFAPYLERHWFDTYGRVALTGESMVFEQYAETLGGRWFEVEAHRVGDPADHEVAILFADITARRAESERQAAIAVEFAHRMKNFTAVIQAIVSQTLRRAQTMEEARLMVAQRLTAFASVQDVFATSPDGSIDIRTVVDAAMKPYQSEQARVRIHGLSHPMSQQQGLGLSLALNELATNATKYGALSDGRGTVAITWKAADGKFDLEWLEMDGPRVAAPDASGFGTRLIDSIASGYFGGTSRTEYRPDGLRFNLAGHIG